MKEPDGRLEARLESWRAVRAWLAWQQRQAERTIRALEAELAAGAPRRAAPTPAAPDWKLEAVRTGHGPEALSVHIGDCSMGDGRAITREEARRLLAEGVGPCPFCSPENALGMTG
nr:DUF6233 domain-containing protein [Streptomyces sp. NBC_00974]